MNSGQHYSIYQCGFHSVITRAQIGRLSLSKVGHMLHQSCISLLLTTAISNPGMWNLSYPQSPESFTISHTKSHTGLRTSHPRNNSSLAGPSKTSAPLAHRLPPSPRKKKSNTLTDSHNHPHYTCTWVKQLPALVQK